MKLHVAICDDEKTEIDYLEKLSKEWAALRKINAVVSVYTSAEAFLFAFEADKSFDILLLDIHMKEIDGITLAKRLRMDGGKMQIVFITGLPDFISEGYEVSALHYLMKPVHVEKLNAVLDKALDIIDKPEASIFVETADGTARLSLRDILYAEAFSHTTMIYMLDISFEVKISIGELEALLDESFFRCHRSYLVGLRYVRQIAKADVIMDNGKLIPLSRRRYNALNEAFIRYFRGAEG